MPGRCSRPNSRTSAGARLETQIVFSAGLALFAIVMVFAGRKLATWGPQRLAMMGGITLGIGYVDRRLSAGA